MRWTIRNYLHHKWNCARCSTLTPFWACYWLNASTHVIQKHTARVDDSLPVVLNIISQLQARCGYRTTN
jgi:hypothetical protein